MRVKPATGLKIRDPDLRDILPDEGRTVPESGYWTRRLRDGDVIEVEDDGTPIKRDADGNKVSGPAQRSPAKRSTRADGDAP